MGGLFESAGSLLERRRLLTTWLPVFVFVSALAAIPIIAVGRQDFNRWWATLPGPVHTLFPLACVIGTVLAAELLAALRPSVIRLYEGYWESLPFGRRIAAWARARWTDDPERPWVQPTPDQRMPTRLGNILRAAEQQASRYGMDAVTAWPRLYTALPETFTLHLGKAAGAFELLVTVSFLGALFAALGGVVAAVSLGWFWGLTCLWAGILIAWVGYRGALRSAQTYGDLVRTAFDVHRWQLLDAMGLQRPAGYGEEIAQWTQIHQVWQRGRPDSGAARLLGYPPRDTGPGRDDQTSTAELPAEVTEHRPPTPVTRSAAKRMTVSLLILGTSAVLLGGLWPRFERPGGVTATHDLGDFHILTANDLSRPVPQFLGRYTLRPVKKNAKIALRDLGPILGSPGLAGLSVGTLRVRPSAFAVPRGKVVTLVGGGPAGGRPTVVSGVLILDVPSSGTLVVAAPLNDLERLLSAKANDLHIVRPALSALGEP